MSGVDRSSERLLDAVARISRRIAHWTPPRWAAAASRPSPAEFSSDGAGGAARFPATVSGTGPLLSRAQLVHQLVQRMADLAADAEGIRRRAVPRLENDLALPDQLAVLTQDLLAADPPEELVTAATTAVEVTSHAL